MGLFDILFGDNSSIEREIAYKDRMRKKEAFVDAQDTFIRNWRSERNKELDKLSNTKRSLRTKLRRECNADIEKYEAELSNLQIPEAEKELERNKYIDKREDEYQAAKDNLEEEFDKKEQELYETYRTENAYAEFDKSIIAPYFSNLANKIVTADVIGIVGSSLCYDVAISNIEDITCATRNPRIQFVHENDAKRLIPNLEDEVYEGDILFKHPFLPNTYVDAKESEQTFFKQKLDRFSRVCQLLGAKSVTGQGMWVSQQQLTIDADGNVGYKGVELTGSIKTNEKSRLEQSYSLKETFLSSEPNISEAEALAKKYGLYKEMQTLIEGRMYSNSLQSRDVTITLSDELNKEKEIAFSLNAMKVFELSGSMKQTIETVSTVKYKIHVEF